MELPPPPPPPPPERSKRLHNFTLPYLRWGQQRFLRCVKLPSSSSSSPSPDRAIHGSPAPLPGGESAQQQPKVSALGNNGGVDAAAARPWNLRTRRAACNEPGGGGDETTTTTRIITTTTTTHETGVVVKRGGSGSSNQEGGGGDPSSQQKQVKFCVALLREEIEEDFTALIGKKPPRRPKKRPRLVQKQMNTLFPGLWLAEEVTIGSYDVPEAAPAPADT
ncbi:hypothetical protein Rs2_20724 [Raphanus sativus]|uniref:Uncharacterized protein LOC108859586 n=1 Tax=Raphanus sativus TaxID=3726 RepID=A0A6J0NW12_RAPSA|nr:uncharacterized protein LOC108859586 [Raphanus sativus]XP_056866188.1 uncharacterized protein LOC108859586 [Raphanus sativus]KAJ4893930.1 hypothetical protein Rs2_20724 [Raphanus sativus]